MFRRRFSPIFAFFFALSASAAIGDRFGYTSRDAALAGARAGAEEISSSSAFLNPAQMSLGPETAGETRRVARFHWSVLYAESRFAEIRNVVIENPVNSDLNAGDRLGNVNTKYPTTLGQSIGFALSSRKSDRRWALGAIAYLPLDRLALMDSGESFIPEYTLHRGRNQKPEFQVALSGLVTRNLSFGAGIYLGARLTSDTTIFLNQGVGTVSTMRIAASLKTQASPYFGLSYLPRSDLSLGLVARLASRSPQSLNVQANARAVGTVTAPDFSFPALATMYYDPFSISAGMQWRYADARALSFQLDYQAWGKFEPPTVVILNQQCDPNCGVDFADGRSLARPTRNLLVPRLAHVWTIGTQELRAGYLYRPGIYRAPPSDAGNAIDPDEHRIALGYAWAIEEIPLFDAPGRFDLHGAYSLYARRNVVKSAGDENGNAAHRKIGAPGYEIGGSGWDAGFTFELSL